MFNELVLDQYNKPHNPMVNAGAIVICSLLINLIEVSELCNFYPPNYSNCLYAAQLGSLREV